MNEVNRTCRNIDWLINTMHVIRGYVYTWNHGVHHLSYCQYVLLVYELFWTQACSEGMGTNGTRVPCEVSSLPNPTTRKSWPHHWGLRPLLFSNSDVGSFTSHMNQISESAVRRDLRFFVLIREDYKVICRCNYKGSTFFSVI